MSGRERHAFVAGARPERRQEYLALHRAVWAQAESSLTACHMTNYSIFLTGDILFAYEYTDHDVDMGRIAPERVPGALWQPIDEIRHLP